MIRHQLASKIQASIDSLIQEGLIPAADYRAVSLEEPRNAAHGDFAISWAMQASKLAGKNPRELGDLLAACLSALPEFSNVEVAGPGFINLTLTDDFAASYLPSILQSEGKKVTEGHYAFSPTPNPKRINVEFVSVNPNGPITIGSGRGAAYGSALCTILEAAGNTVWREYYINDGVNSEQMRLFAESVRAIIGGRHVPDNGYKGDYVYEVAETVKNLFQQGFQNQIAYARKVLSDGPNPVIQRHLECFDRLQTLLDQHGPEKVGDACELDDLKLISETLMSDKQSADLKAFGVTFDTWFSEQSLHDLGMVASDVADLEAKGAASDAPHRTIIKFKKGGVIEEVKNELQATDEDDSADGTLPTLWLRSTKFGDDMDRVLRRRDGRLTYIASDVTYHKDKLNRPKDADKMITILGPDHHGYIGRLTAVVAAMLMSPDKAKEGTEWTEFDAQIYANQAEKAQCLAALDEAKQKLEVQIFQLVRFLKDGKPAPMRKRDGNIYALIDLIKEIGAKVKPNGTPEEKTAAGRDVARFFYLMRNHDTTFDFDLDLAEKQSDENPVFYVQYAHARICSVIAKASEAGIKAGEFKLTDPKEKALLLKILELAAVIEKAADDYAVNRLTSYATELARTYHAFYDACRVIDTANPETSSSRLALCEAARIGLRTVFELLGISAPDRMERDTAG